MHFHESTCHLLFRQLTFSFLFGFNFKLHSFVSISLLCSQVLINLYNRVGQTYYGFYYPPLDKCRRPGKPRTPHNSNLCQACKDGLCTNRKWSFFLSLFSKGNYNLMSFPNTFLGHFFIFYFCSIIYWSP